MGTNDWDERTTADALAGNLLTDLPDQPRAEEVFETLFSHSNVRLERIISTGQASAPDFWYDQPQAEWVLVVQGGATVRFEDESESRSLTAGDYLYIAPHRRHQVQHTQTYPPTVWLAIHMDG